MGLLLLLALWIVVLVIWGSTGLLAAHDRLQRAAPPRQPAAPAGFWALLWTETVQSGRELRALWRRL